jgi:hypothetical protein
MGVVISVSPGSVAEGDAYTRPVDFVVSLSEPSTTNVTVDFHTLDGTALENVDFERLGQRGYGTLTFFPGETSKIIGVAAVGDRLVEPDENFTLELFNPRGATLDGDAPALRANGIILDDDGTGSKLALFVSNPILLEGDSGTSFAQFTVTLSRPSATAITLPYTTADGTATAGEDYTATSGTLTFAPGQTTATVNVPVIGDTKVEASETFSLVVTPSPEIANGTAASTGQALIVDDDSGGSLPTVSVRGAEISEGNANTSPLRFVVSLSKPSATAVTVDFQTVGGTALENVDFERIGQGGAGTIIFQPGETSKIIGTAAVGDRLPESDENLTLELFNPKGAALADNAPALRAQGVILDDDGAGSKLALFVSNPILLEGDSGTKLAQFTVSLSRPSETTITLPYRTVDGTATAGEDYTPMSGTLIFAPGQTTAAVNVPVIGDTRVEPSETFSLVVTPSAEITNGTAGSTGQALILDDDAGGNTQPTMSVRGGEIVEGGPLRFVVSLSQPASATVTVSYRAVSGTALENVDFERVGQAGYGTLLFTPGQTSRIVSIGTIGDHIAEPTENFSLQLFNPHGVAFAGGGLTLSAEGFILDNSPPCFVAGTCILTDQGEVPVERLREGDRVVTIDQPGARRTLPIEWIGRRRVDCSRQPEPRKVHPVRVRKDAFAPGTPSRDVWLSPDHAVYADDVLIPVKHLINGRTITREQRAEITYYHIELAEHAVLLAEGLPAESLVPGSDRSRFANGGGRVRLHPDFDALAWEADGCAPLIVTGPTFESVRRRLVEQADDLCAPAPQVANG